MKFLVFFNYSLISRMTRLRIMDMKSPIFSLQRSLPLNRIFLRRIIKLASITFTILAILGILVSKDVTPPSLDGAGSKKSCHSPTAKLLAETRDLDGVHISEDQVHISEAQQFYLPQLEAIRNGSLITPQQVGIIGHNHDIVALEPLINIICWLEK